MKYRVAIGTLDGEYITEHFGHCAQFRIVEIDQDNDEVTYIEDRNTEYQQQCGAHNHDKILGKIQSLQDCSIVLVKQIGGQSEKLLTLNGIIPLQYEGSIQDALVKIKKFYKKQIIRH